MPLSQFFTYIDSLNVSKGWKNTFKKIHVVYHDNYSNGKNINSHLWGKSRDFKNISSKDQRRFFVNFNLFALLMGPFYYIQKKMFKKGLILFCIFLPFFLISNVTKLFLIPLFIYCAYFANRDYFIATILKKKDEYNVLLLNDLPDRYFIYDVIEKPYNRVPFVVTTTIFVILIGYFILNSFMQTYELQDYLENTPVVCRGGQECQKYIMDAVKEISLIRDSEEISKKYYLIASAYLGNNDLYNAINALNLALNINPNNMSALYLRADLCYKNKRYSQAVIDYKSILKVAPRAYFVHFYLGRCFYQLGMYADASFSFKIAANKCRQASYYEYWGYSELKNGHKEEAIKILKKALKLYSNETGSQNKEKEATLSEYIKKLERSR